MPAVGFTGTQRGLTPPQRARLAYVLQSLAARGFRTLHHGDCIGADAEAHALAVQVGMGVVIHPPENASKRAFCTGDECHPTKPYLERNHDIVDASSLLVACPGDMVEQLRSGTWATMRYARKHTKRVMVLFPDGTFEVRQ